MKNKKPFWVPILFICLLCFGSLSYADEFSNKSSMNGFTMKDFKDFESLWHQVTVRYRDDNKELRFIYANDIAWKAINEKSIEYPKGAIFAKAAYLTGEDKSFTSSRVPADQLRYQFMVRDKEKFKETDGWGYALFNKKGLTFGGDPKINSIACAACHRIVPDRGYVFSQVLVMKPFVSSIQNTALQGDTSIAKHLKFKNASPNRYNALLKNLIPRQFHNVRSLVGEIQENIFQGTANEIMPVLSAETMSTNLPAVLYGKNGKYFALAYVEKNDHTCAGDSRKVFTIRTITPQDGLPDDTHIRIRSFCKNIIN